MRGLLASTSALLRFEEIRARLGNGWGWRLATGIAVGFAFLSMLSGGMLVLENIQGSSTVQLVTLPGAPNWWDFPELIAVQPWGYLALPLLPTIAMAVVSAGTGIGGAVAATLLVPYLFRSGEGARGRAAAGVAAGATPGLAGFAALGACCCTGCTSAAGVALVAAASGTSFSTLLFNDWYLGLFQIAVVLLTLLFQERVLRSSRESPRRVSRGDARDLGAALLRVGLLVGGLTWSLAMFVEWAGAANLATAGPGLWFHWLVEHQLLSALAVGAAFFPRELADAFGRLGRRVGVRTLRIALLVGGLTWGLGVPPVLLAAGLGGTVNELLGLLGVPGAWGGVVPEDPVGATLLFHWLIQHLLLAGFALAVAAQPVRTLAWLGRSADSPAGAERASAAEPEPRGEIPATAPDRPASVLAENAEGPLT